MKPPRKFPQGRKSIEPDAVAVTRTVRLPPGFESRLCQYAHATGKPPSTALRELAAVALDEWDAANQMLPGMEGDA